MRSNNIIAVDNSLNSPGLACFIDGKLVIAERVKPKHASDTVIMRALETAQLVCSRVMRDKVLAAMIARGDYNVVMEMPQIYNAKTSKANPNQLLPVAIVGGMIAATLATKQEIFAYTPHEWIGNLPKSTKGDPRESPRGARIWATLNPAEKQISDGKNHDAFDAIGLGLYHLGRLAKRAKVISDGTLPDHAWKE